jgi:hypothetical protein
MPMYQKDIGTMLSPFFSDTYHCTTNRMKNTNWAKSRR